MAIPGKAQVHKILNFDTKKDGIIHDAQYDFYGKKLATCSSYGVVSIYDMTSPTNTAVELASFQAHTCSIWQISWANPRFGNILATCGFDKEVSIFKEFSTNEWKKHRGYSLHEMSVNSVAWAPWEFGLRLAACSSDGFISFISRRGDETWDKEQKFSAHDEGVNSIVWGPVIENEENLIEISEDFKPLQRLISASCDNTLKIWKYNYKEKRFDILLTLEKHTDWVRDVAWCPSNGTPFDIIASCSELLFGK